MFTISWATASGTSLLRSKVNSIAPLSLYFPFSFFWSSTQSLRAIDVFLPSSSSASSTLTPVSSAKKAWFSRSLMEYLGKEKSHAIGSLTFSSEIQYTYTVLFQQGINGRLVLIPALVYFHAWRYAILHSNGGKNKRSQCPNARTHTRTHSNTITA